MESSFDTNTNGWTNNGGVIKEDPRCPLAGPCLELENGDEIIRSTSTLGYHSIEFSYLLESTQVSGRCEVWYGSGDWTLVDQQQSANSLSNPLIAFDASDGVTDNPNLWIRLHANLSTCYINSALLTGIRITLSPTLARADPSNEPTPSPTPSPFSLEQPPTEIPTNEPTKTPSTTPSAPTSDPTNDLTKNPSDQPTSRPSRDPTQNPTPIEKSGQVLGFSTTQEDGTKNILDIGDDPLVTLLIILLGVACCIILYLICIIFGLCVLIKKRVTSTDTIQHMKYPQLSQHVTSISLGSMNADRNDIDELQRINNANPNEKDSDSESNGMYKTHKVAKESDNGNMFIMAMKKMANTTYEVAKQTEKSTEGKQGITQTPDTPNIGDV